MERSVSVALPGPLLLASGAIAGGLGLLGQGERLGEDLPGPGL